MNCDYSALELFFGKCKNRFRDFPGLHNTKTDGAVISDRRRVFYVVMLNYFRELEKL